MLTTTQFNPDVLSCLANLSSDEVFTPPKLANEMLDLLPKKLWSNKNAKFLDPMCKTGVFLREIAKRLLVGLEKEIPDLQTRIDHIFKNQIYGIGITELTALIARRTLYCSKNANGEKSVVNFDNEEGNILFKRIDHAWKNERCAFCGASKGEYDRDGDLETHAYQLIHTENPEEIFDMKFDVIIGNPPYQLGSDGGTRDVPIYNKFVEQAKKLRPRYLSMIIPSRWMASGLGLGEFRRAMLSDRNIRELVDYPAANDVFPQVEVKAGVCYFLWDSSYDGDCKVTTIRGRDVVGPIQRNLGEYDVFVRDARAVSILHKVLKLSEPSINTILARDKEFGWTSNFDGFHEKEAAGDVPLFYIRKMKRGVGYIARNSVTKSTHLIDTWKVLVPEAFNGGDSLPHQILGKPLIAPLPSVCTQSFLFFHVASLKAAESIKSYYLTRFFRFLVSIRKITQHATHSTYLWVPMQTWDCTWTDNDLYEKYGLTKEEISFIESMVRPLDSDLFD